MTVLIFMPGVRVLGTLPCRAKPPGSAHFDRPLLRLTLGIADRYQDPAAQIRPLEFLDCAFQDLCIFRIEHSKRMVRNSGNGSQATAK